MISWLDTLVQDGRQAARGLRRSPGYALTAIGMLTLGIGVNAAVFTIAYSVLFKGFPLVERNDELVYMSIFGGGGVSYSEFVDWQAQAASFEGMALVHGLAQVYSDENGFPETLTSTEVSAGTFALVGQQPTLGRDFTSADEAPGAAPVAILSYAFWERQYQRDPAVLGRTVRVNGSPTTVVGVMPRGFSFPQKQEIWVPMAPTPLLLERSNRDNWFVIGRLADGATLASARAEMQIIGRRLEAAYPATNTGLLPRVQTFHEFFIGARATTIYAAMIGAVTFVLLIACANLANLLLARALSRSREISVRVALGAPRRRIVRQLLLESLMLSVAGGIAGWWLAKVAVRVFSLVANGPSVSDAIGGVWWDGMTDYALDSRVLAYCAALSIGTGLLFGLAPARRVLKLDVNAGLKDGSRGATGTRSKNLSAALLAVEMALAIVLLAGSGVMVRSFLNVYSADVGARIADIGVGLVTPRAPRYPDASSRTRFLTTLEERLAGAPEVESFALATTLPTQPTRAVPYEVEGALPVPVRNSPRVGAVAISPSYFHTFGTALIAGRSFDAQDVPEAPSVAIVNERFASTLWPGESALARRFRLLEDGVPGDWLTVVGVAPNIAQNDATRQRKDPLIYLPYSQRLPSTVWIVASARTTGAAAATAIQRELRAIDPDQPLGLGPSPLEDYLAWNYQYRGTSGMLFLACAAIALLLASVGLYAVISYSVSQHTREIGVRIAIGASERNILALVFREGIVPLTVGLVVGLAAALAVNSLLASLLVGVSPADPVTLGATCAVLALAAALGCWSPARRAARVDPVVALRQG